MSKLNIVQRFLLWSSGVDSRILGKDEWLTERYKYSAIGATVVLTSTMSFLSGGYALFTVFGSTTAFLLGGTVWSSIIFNLDRFFILSAKRRKSDSLYAYVAATFLRLVIAVMLSFVIAKPLELRLFEVEVEQEIRRKTSEDRNDAIVEQQNDVDSALNSIKRDIQEIDDRIAELNAQIRDAQDSWQLASERATDELTGASGTGRPGDGIVFEERKQEADRLFSALQRIEQSNNLTIQGLQEQRAVLIQRQDEIIASFENSASPAFSDESDVDEFSLLQRLSALERLSANDPTVAAINNLVTVLFIVLEVSPTLVKILSGKGPYDTFSEHHELYVMPQQYLQELEMRKMEGAKKLLLFSLDKAKDLELDLEKLKGDYLRGKNLSKEKLYNINEEEFLSTVGEAYRKEIEAFIELCDKDRYLYRAIVANMLRKMEYLDKSTQKAQK